MKKHDLIVIAIVLLTVSMFLLLTPLSSAYTFLNDTHGMWMSFFKFAVLATFGESLALRIRTGRYGHKGFGWFPKAVVWGLLGFTIKLAFVIFANGTPAFLAYLGYTFAPTAIQDAFSFQKVIVAFCISMTMNLIYAPVMMTLHRITDAHISQWNGRAIALVRPIQLRKIFNTMDWDSLWNFVFKKSIPLFWIPAHTITFLLPESYQVLFAAFLSLILGVILSFAMRK
ncbi:MAG: Mpv17/PMP22 family protein [Bacteroidales bacterium]|jgi:hypothetical protein|nr:Mpv17/PMP22 family protein [Bacteroidales bacterium]MCK9447908.1 Mpv17/PMP22 family protein [Bacteroidales bacterium]MDD3701146.1 Mpv17/PMP22 family protein [Bacteroidales bacterium]MDY0368593.1 Mpv17/PMP22 family protein [Bacteroidales bacterium]